jgi:hypothetical protein
VPFARLIGGGLVDAAPMERADIGMEMGGDEMASVVALKVCPSDSPQ